MPRSDGICGTDLKIGDVVQLKSGGPAMTVVGDVDGRELRCAYFLHDGEGCHDEFNVILLPREALKDPEL